MPRSNLVRVILWMTGALLAFSLMAVAIRGLSPTLTVIEMLAVRSGMAFFLFLPLIAVRPDLRLLVRTPLFGLHVFRNIVHLGAQYLWAWSLLLLPLATVFALEFTAPAWALLLAVTVLGERLTPSRLGVVVLGLIGILVILRPGIIAFEPAVLIVQGAAFGFAIALTTTKRLTRIDSTFTIIFWMNVIQFPLAMLGSDPLFVTKLALHQWPAFFAVGLTGILSHYCLTNAFRAGDASVVVPLDFLRIPLIAAAGWLLFDEKLDLFVFLGAGIIITGILWNLRSEAAKAPVPAADQARTTQK